jgi:hypothetical protein
LVVTFVVIAALFPTLKSAINSYSSAAGDAISAALIVLVPLAIAVGVLLYALRETGLV